jgi:bifunctional non-homologous end joining protein LigD
MPTVPWRGNIAAIRPMLATLEEAPLHASGLVYEPKYDGIRALIEISPKQRTPVCIWSRLGNDKTAQFPDIVAALARPASTLRAPLVLDGEIVALDERGEPAGFQRLQNRIHLTEANSQTATGRVAFIAFDVLRDGSEDLRPLPFVERRARLERLMKAFRSPIVRISDVVPQDGRALYQRALDQGWEGLIAKDARSVYHTGKRTRDWRKLKIVQEQELVVGGWTEARTSGRAFGALLLGYYEDGHLKYAGHTGSGFDHPELERVIRLLKPLETPTPPFTVRPRTNERPHWVKPKLVAQLKFTEWTNDGLLRHPIYLGLRDDVRAENVRREQTRRSPPGDRPSSKVHRPTSVGRKTTVRRRSTLDDSRLTMDDGRSTMADLVSQLTDLERGPNGGTLRLPDGATLEVSNLRKVFWPKLKLTKGDLLRFYVKVSPFILPVIRNRPLIMKRYPNGIDAPPFFQHKAPEKIPAGVRTAKVPGDSVASRPIGGDLLTLLYMTQLAAISQDPWFSRVESPHTADHCAIDLDPMPDVKVQQIVDAARWVHDELQRLKVPGFPKTSGSRGIHVYIPLREGTPYQSGQIFCEIVATMVAEKHPAAATVVRSVRARGRKVYLDYLQNIEGKSLACAYSARASDFAGASTPLAWAELDAGIDPRDFTIQTLPDRLASVGDLWAPLTKAKGVDLRKILK